MGRRKECQFTTVEQFSSWYAQNAPAVCPVLIPPSAVIQLTELCCPQQGEVCTGERCHRSCPVLWAIPRIQPGRHLPGKAGGEHDLSRSIGSHLCKLF